MTRPVLSHVPDATQAEQWHPYLTPAEVYEVMRRLREIYTVGKPRSRRRALQRRFSALMQRAYGNYPNAPGQYRQILLNTLNDLRSAAP